MSDESKLGNLRQQIGSLDSQIVSLLNERASLSQEVGQAKKSSLGNDVEVEVYAPGQEKAVFERVEDLNVGPLSSDSLKAIYREIMSASISLQKDVKIGYLGPKGTFTHQAAQERFGDSVTYIPISSTRAIFTALEEGSITYAVIPFENSTTGVVTESLDALMEFKEVKIRAEIYLSITQALLSHFQNNGIRRIYSHRVAFGQCSRWLDTHFPNVERVNVASTARAAELASTEMYSAAICSEFCSKLYDVPVLNPSVADNKYNYTRFHVLGRSEETETGDDKTFLSFTVDHRQPGALCNGLEVFKEFGLNLTKIDTRPYPVKLNPWHYVFFVEFIGHSKNSKVQEALNSLSKYCLDLQVLGSYPSQSPPKKE